MVKVAVTKNLTSEKIDANDTAAGIGLITCDECLIWQEICEQFGMPKKISVCDLRVV